AALAPHEHVDSPAAAHPDHSLLPATEGGGSSTVRANEVSHDHLHVSRRRQGRSHTVPKYSIPLYPTRRAVVAFGLSAKSSGTRSASVRAILDTCLYSSARSVGSASALDLLTRPTISIA